VREADAQAGQALQHAAEDEARGGNQVAIKFALNPLAPLWTAFARIAVSALAVGVYARSAGIRLWPEARKFISQPPSHYAKRLYFDTLTHDPKLLAFNLEKFGSGQIMIGSDYPFDMGVDHPLAQLEGVALSAADRDNLTYKTAQRYLGLTRNT
jgi:hypothetical protein